MKKILLDTNFLLIPGQFKVDIFSELDRICDFSFEIAVLDRTIEELKSIYEKQKGKDKRAAKLALGLLDAKKLAIIKTDDKEKSTDGAILDIAKAKGFIVATQDMELKKRLKESGVRCVYLRQKSYLAMS